MKKSKKMKGKARSLKQKKLLRQKDRARQRRQARKDRPGGATVRYHAGYDYDAIDVDFDFDEHHRIALLEDEEADTSPMLLSDLEKEQQDAAPPPTKAKSHSSTTRERYRELERRHAEDPRGPRGWPLSGKLQRSVVNGETCWMLSRSRRTSPEPEGVRDCLGPVDEPGMQERVERFKLARAAYRDRADSLVTVLKRSGVAAPMGGVADLLLGLHDYGVLEQVVLLGDVGVQACGLLCGFKLFDTHFRATGVDLAPMPGKAPPLDLLARVGIFDRGFRPLVEADGATPASWINASHVRLNVLVDDAGDEAGAGSGPVYSDMLGVHGQPTPFLKYLVSEPVDALLLVQGGLAARVPDPARMALHRLLTSQMAGNEDAADHFFQAKQLLEMVIRDRPESLIRAQRELRKQGGDWAELIMKGFDRLAEKGASSVLSFFREHPY